MKTLKTLQIFAKIGKILSKIIFICSLVGGILCVVGLCTAWIPAVIKIGNVTIHGIVGKEASVSIWTVYAVMFSGFVFCLFETILAKYAENFFKFELQTETPFDLAVSKKLFDLGIKTIWMPLVATVIAGLGHAVFAHISKTVHMLDFDGHAQVGLGLTFIVVSLILKAAVEIKNENNAENETKTE